MLTQLPSLLAACKRTRSLHEYPDFSGTPVRLGLYEGCRAFCGRPHPRCVARRSGKKRPARGRALLASFAARPAWLLNRSLLLFLFLLLFVLIASCARARERFRACMQGDGFFFSMWFKPRSFLARCTAQPVRFSLFVAGPPALRMGEKGAVWLAENRFRCGPRS